MKKKDIVLLDGQEIKRRITGTFGNRYSLQLVTTEYIFYGHVSESDENVNTIMYSRSMKLISDNYFATVGMNNAAEEPDKILWSSRAFKYWQKQLSETE